MMKLSLLFCLLFLGCEQLPLHTQTNDYVLVADADVFAAATHYPDIPSTPATEPPPAAPAPAPAASIPKNMQEYFATFGEDKLLLVSASWCGACKPLITQVKNSDFADQVHIIVLDKEKQWIQNIVTSFVPEYPTCFKLQNGKPRRLVASNRGGAISLEDMRWFLPKKQVSRNSGTSVQWILKNYSGPPAYVTGDTEYNHLITIHGVRPEELAGLTRRQLELVHGYYH